MPKSSACCAAWCGACMSFECVLFRLADDDEDSATDESGDLRFRGGIFEAVLVEYAIVTGNRVNGSRSRRYRNGTVITMIIEKDRNLFQNGFKKGEKKHFNVVQAGDVIGYAADPRCRQTIVQWFALDRSQIVQIALGIGPRFYFY